MPEKKSPADKAIAAFGGVESFADAVGCSVHQAYRLRREREKGGHGGVIPARLQGAILKAARARRLPLKAEDLIDMRPEHVRAREDVQ